MRSYISFNELEELGETIVKEYQRKTKRKNALCVDIEGLVTDYLGLAVSLTVTDVPFSIDPADVVCVPDGVLEPDVSGDAFEAPFGLETVASFQLVCGTYPVSFVIVTPS